MADNPKASLGPYPVSAETMKRLAAMQQAVRDIGHGPPSKGLLLSALLAKAPTDGKQIEDEYLVPYRLAHPDEDQPR